MVELDLHVRFVSSMAWEDVLSRDVYEHMARREGDLVLARLEEGERIQTGVEVSKQGFLRFITVHDGLTINTQRTTVFRIATEANTINKDSVVCSYRN